MIKGGKVGVVVQGFLVEAEGFRVRIVEEEMPKEMPKEREGRRRWWW